MRGPSQEKNCPAGGEIHARRALFVQSLFVSSPSMTNFLSFLRRGSTSADEN